MPRSSSTRISPTAHWISYLKHRGGLCEPELTTRTGRFLHLVMWPFMAAGRVLGGLDPTQIIVARHRGLDHLLREAIEAGEITQVIEIAAGLSPRGREFMARYGERGLIYVEGDLAEISACKREALARMGPLAPGHHVLELDALLDAGPTSLAEVGQRVLDPGAGTAVVCEGLTPYLDAETLAGLWRRIARALSGYARARMFTEVYFPVDLDGYPLVNVLRGLVAAMTRGRLHLIFEDAAQVEAELARAQFTGARVDRLGDLLAELGLEGDPDEMPVHLVRAELGLDEPEG